MMNQSVVSNVQIERALVEEFHSVLHVPNLDIRVEEDLRHYGLTLAASFKALMVDRPEPTFVDVYATWWDHFKGECLRSAVVLNLVSPPKLVRVKRLLRMCPHIATDQRTHVDFLFHDGVSL